MAKEIKEKKEKKDVFNEVVDFLVTEIPNAYDTPPSRAIDRSSVVTIVEKLKEIVSCI